MNVGIPEQTITLTWWFASLLIASQLIGIALAFWAIVSIAEKMGRRRNGDHITKIEKAENVATSQSTMHTKDEETDDSR